MGNSVDETRDSDAQPIAEEKPAHDEPTAQAEAREEEPVEAAALEAENDDDEYEMVDPSEFVDVDKIAEADEALTTRPADVAPMEPAHEPIEPDLLTRELVAPIQLELDLDEPSAGEAHIAAAQEAPILAAEDGLAVEPPAVEPDAVERNVVEPVAVEPPAFAAEAQPGVPADEELTAKAPPVATTDLPEESAATQEPDPEPSPVTPPRRHSHVPLPPPVKVAKALSTTSASIPPPPRVPSRTMPPPPPIKTQAFEKGHVPPPPALRRTSTSLPPPPRATISSSPPLTMSGTLPPIPRPSIDRRGARERSWSGKRFAAAAVITVVLATAYLGAKRSDAPISAPSREAAAAIPAPEPQPQPQAVAAEPVATAAVLVAEESDPKPMPLPASNEHPTKVAKESPASDNSKKALPPPSEKALPSASEKAVPSATDRAELAAIAVKVDAPKAAACTMNFNTIPPSRVALDGRDLGMTPKLGVSVAPGNHVVTFANSGGKKVASAQCKAGEQKTIALHLPM